jgi:hypothetical protein
MSREDEDAARFFERFRAPELGLSTVDIARAVQDGRRRASRRFAAVSVAACGLVAVGTVAAMTAPALLATPAKPTSGSPASAAATSSTATTRSAEPARPRTDTVAAPTHCTAHALRLPSGSTEGIVTGGDPTGRYLAGYVYGRGEARPVLWTDGVPKVIDAPHMFGSHVLVNSHGVVAGTGDESVGTRSRYVPWRYEHGMVTRLATSTTSYQLLDLNERGDILAVEVPAVLSIDWPTGRAEPVVLAHDGQVRRLDAPAGVGRDFSGGIDDDGTVAGSALEGGGATVWAPDGQRRSLSPDGLRPGVRDIRNGWVFGGQPLPVGAPGYASVTVWDLRTGATITHESMQYGGSWSVNAHGWVAGATATDPAVGYRDAVVKLPILPGQVGGAGTSAATISDDGRTIGGQATTTEFNIVPMRWTCT